MPKYNNFELDVQKIEIKEENYLILTQKITGLTCPECQPISKYDAC